MSLAHVLAHVVCHLLNTAILPRTFLSHPRAAPPRGLIEATNPRRRPVPKEAADFGWAEAGVLDVTFRLGIPGSDTFEHIVFEETYTGRTTSKDLLAAMVSGPSVPPRPRVGPRGNQDPSVNGSGWPKCVYEYPTCCDNPECEKD